MDNQFKRKEPTEEELIDARLLLCEECEEVYDEGTTCNCTVQGEEM